MTRKALLSRLGSFTYEEAYLRMEWDWLLPHEESAPPKPEAVPLAELIAALESAGCERAMLFL